LGFFDRVLCRFKGVSIGICFEEQLVEQLEQDPWDIPVNVLVTDLHIRDFRKGN
jgi:5-formyltetrahydrofolate cyclo-ligase